MIGKNYYLVILMTIALASCSTENRGKRAVAMNDDNVMVLDRSIVTDTVDLPLSELAEGYELIRFERGELIETLRLSQAEIGSPEANRHQMKLYS